MVRHLKNFAAFALRFWTLDVSWTASYEITIVRLSVPNLNSQKKKKNGDPNLGLEVPKSGPKLGFSPFSEVWFVSFLGNCIE